MWGEHSICALAFSPQDGQFLARGDYTNITVYVTSTQKILTNVFIGQVVWRLAFSPDGKRQAAATRPFSGSGVTLIFDFPSLRQIAEIPDLNNHRPSLAYSPDGRWLAVGRADHTVRLLDTTTHREVATLTGHDGPVVDLAFSPDSRVLVSASEDTTARLWDLATGRELGPLAGHRRPVNSVAFSKDRDWVATGCVDGTIKLWDARSRKELKSLPGHSAFVNAVVFLPDGHTLASASDDNTVKLWELGAFERPTEKQDRFGLARVALFGPDGRSLVTGSDEGIVTVHDLDSERPPTRLPGTGESIHFLALSGDGEHLALASGTNLVQLWRLNPPRLLTSTNVDCSSGQFELAFTWNGRLLVALCNGTLAFTLDVPGTTGREDVRTTGEPVSSAGVRTSDNPRPSLRSVPKLDVIAPTYKVAEQKTVIRTYPENRVLGELDLPWDPSDPLTVAVSPDGRFTAIRCFSTNAVRVWDTRARGQILGPIDLNPFGYGLTYLHGFEFSRDGSLLAMGTSAGTIWLLKSPRFEQFTVLRGHNGWVTSVAFSPDGRTMATAGMDGAVKLWSLATFRELLTMPEHAAPFSTVSFSADSQSLLCLGEDRRIRLWHVTKVTSEPAQQPERKTASIPE